MSSSQMTLNYPRYNSSFPSVLKSEKFVGLKILFLKKLDDHIKCWNKIDLFDYHQSGGKSSILDVTLSERINLNWLTIKATNGQIFIKKYDLFILKIYFKVCCYQIKIEVQSNESKYILGYQFDDSYYFDKGKFYFHKDTFTRYKKA